jgi:AraC-like DNA-binding protein
MPRSDSSPKAAPAQAPQQVANQPLIHARSNQALLNSFEIRLMMRELIEGQGIPLKQLLKNLDVPPSIMEDPGLRLTLNQEMALYTRCAELNTDAMLGFKVGSRLSAANYGILGYAILGAATVEEALNLLTEFAPLISWASRNKLSKETYKRGKKTTPCRCLTLYPAAPNPQAAVLEIDSTVASLQTMFNDLAGEPLQFECVQLTRSEEGLNHTYLKALFNCDIHFNAERNALLISDQLAKLKLPHPQPEYRDLFHDLCKKSMASLLEDQGMLDTLRGLIRDGLGHPEGGQVLGIDDAAKHFDMSARSLRRYLAGMGLTFRKVLDEERYSLAGQYLESTNLTVEEVALRLGYADARSFRVAFWRWGGRAPRG